MNKNNLYELESLYIDINAFINLLDAWAEREAMLEVNLILQELKTKLWEMKNIFQEDNSN